MKRRNLEKEKKEIYDKVRELERRKEMRERKERRNNIVLRRVRWQEMDIEAERFLKNELKMEVMVRKARKIGEKGHENATVIEIGEWEKKREIMERKKNFRKGIYINDDLTKRKRSTNETRGRRQMVQVE